MAKQAGDFKFRGTIDGFCFYKVEEQYYLRRKSSLSGKRFWKERAFEGSRKSCSRFAQGNKLASKVYRMVEEDKRVYSLFCFLKKKAIQLFKEENDLNEAEEILVDYLRAFGLNAGSPYFPADARELHQDMSHETVMEHCHSVDIPAPPAEDKSFGWRSKRENNCDLLHQHRPFAHPGECVEYPLWPPG